MNRLSLKNSLLTMSTRSYSKVTHVIFDVDGLLLDTETLYTVVTQQILDEISPGKIFTWEVKVGLMGLQKEDVSKKIVKMFDLPISWEEYASRAESLIEIVMRNCCLQPDTEKIYENIIKDLAKQYKREYPWEVRMKILGTTERKTCEIAVKELNLPVNVDEFHRQFRLSCFKNLSNVHLFKGAERLVKHFKAHNIPMAVATSSSKESIEVKTTHHKELFELFHHKVMGSSDQDVKEGKPAPDIFLVCASRFPGSVNPANCLVFEDAPNGVKAARSAGMQVVMVPDSHVTEEQKKDATLVISSLDEFKPELFGLPSFHNEAA